MRGAEERSGGEERRRGAEERSGEESRERRGEEKRREWRERRHAVEESGMGGLEKERMRGVERRGGIVPLLMPRCSRMTTSSTPFLRNQYATLTPESPPPIIKVINHPSFTLCFLNAYLIYIFNIPITTTLAEVGGVGEERYC